MADHQKIHPVDHDEIASAPSDSMRSEKADQLIHQSSSHRLSGDHQRIHPLGVEASSSAPIEPGTSFRSERGEPIEQIAPSDGEVVGHSDPPRRKRKWCRCICWTSIILLILIIIIGTIVGILYLVYKPKVPRYYIKNIEINDFKMFPNMTVYASFNVSITAVNRNKKIGIYYDGGHMAVWYTNNSLCNGSMPYFYQRPGNTTVIVVVMTGSTQYGSTLMIELLELQRIGRIPLDLKVKVPVRVKLGALKIKVKFRVRCSLVVDRLSAKNSVVVYEGVIREKPSSKDEARLFVKGYSGSHTSTVGSVLVTNLKTGVRRGAWDKAEVHFHDIPDEVIEELIEEGVVLHVAGGLLLENPLISRFVEAVVGTADSVMGLPKELTEKLIQEAL